MKRVPYIAIFSALIVSCLSWVLFQKEFKSPNTSINFVLIITDDQTWEHLGTYGDPVVRTPNIDRLAAEGVRFMHCFNSAPACAPSRASMLTGRHFWELEEAAIHFSFFPGHLTTFTDVLRQHNYKVGYTGKGWGPGTWQGHRSTDPCGENFDRIFYDEVPAGINKNHYAANFGEFLKSHGGAPFFFTIGTTEPHRDLAFGMGKKSGLDPAKVVVPGFLPDDPTVRADILDYYYEIEWVDKQVGEVIDLLVQHQLEKNTVVIFTSDNGMAFPRAKSNLYDHGSRLPLIIKGPGINRGLVFEDFTSLPDLAPTILEAAGLPIPEIMNHRSLWLRLTGEDDRSSTDSEFVVMGKELHGWCQPDGEINPVRAIRTKEYLYIENLKPHLWPAGHPNPEYAWDLMPFGDVDSGPSKYLMIQNASEGEDLELFQFAFGKRPAEELYYIEDDPYQLTNLALRPGYKNVKSDLQNTLHNYLKEMGDPRSTAGQAATFENAPYYWSHGLQTGGLPPEKWNSMDLEQQQMVKDSIKPILLERQHLIPVIK